MVLYQEVGVVRRCARFILIMAGMFLALGTAQGEMVKVLRVMDGDTCLLEDGREVRYLGIEAPEKDDAFFEQATKANNLLVGGKEVRIESGGFGKDRYGRLLAYLFVDDVFVNEELLRQGYAHIRRPLAAEYKGRFLNVQDKARVAGRGIWKKTKGVDIAITEINPNPEGDDRRNLGREYIIIQNRGDKPIDFTGWTVSDEANHRYLFPNFILKAKSQVKLCTCLGKNTEDTLFWGSRAAVWNNQGDSIFIRDADGNLMLIYIY